MLTGKRRWLAAAVALAVVAAAAAAFLSARSRPAAFEPRPPEARPELLLLTTLPIVFTEEFTLEASGSPVLAALQDRYRVVPISVADRQSLASHSLLLMAQPRAQPAEILVELDDWVRSGGRLLLLADPVLQWPSKRPLGDVLRTPIAFADTGLLGHWSLRLDAPADLGSKTLDIHGRKVRTVAPGELSAASQSCAVDRSRLVARCTIGKGFATVIADADFLDVERLEGSKADNLGLLLGELERLDH